jgi:6-pyruvoyl-tetrahydropterin synthase
MILTGASWHFSASHRDAVRRELHGHSYVVRVEEPSGADVTELQDRLKAACAELDHITLPDEITRAEDLIPLFRERLPHSVSIHIERPVEGLWARWSA